MLRHLPAGCLIRAWPAQGMKLRCACRKAKERRERLRYAQPAPDYVPLASGMAPAEAAATARPKKGESESDEEGEDDPRLRMTFLGRDKPVKQQKPVFAPADAHPEVCVPAACGFMGSFMQQPGSSAAYAPARACKGCIQASFILVETWRAIDSCIALLSLCYYFCPPSTMLPAVILCQNETCSKLGASRQISSCPCHACRTTRMRMTTDGWMSRYAKGVGAMPAQQHHRPQAVQLQVNGQHSGSRWRLPWHLPSSWQASAPMGKLSSAACCRACSACR